MQFVVCCSYFYFFKKDLYKVPEFSSEEERTSLYLYI